MHGNNVVEQRKVSEKTRSEVADVFSDFVSWVPHVRSGLK